MANSLFDAFVGVQTLDSNYLGPQQYLEPTQHNIRLSENQAAQEENDVFYCGRCRQQYSSLNVFLAHKNKCQQHQKVQSQQSVYALNPRQIQTQVEEALAPALQSQYTASVILPDELLSLTQESQNSSLNTPIVGGNGRNNPFINPQQQISSNQHAVAANRQSMLMPNPAPSTALQPVPVSLTRLSNVPQQQQERHRLATCSIAGASTSSNDNMLLLIDSRTGNKHSVEFHPSLLNTEHSYTYSTNAYLDNSAPVEQVPTRPQIQPQAPEPVPEAMDDMPDPPSRRSQVTKTKTKRRKGKASLQCKYCRKDFSKKFDLDQHVRAHTGDKPFQCVVCGRTFSQKSNVKKHMQTHKVWPAGKNPTLAEQPPSQLMVVQQTQPDEPRPSDRTSPGQTPYDNTRDPESKLKWSFLVDSSYICPYCQEKTKFDTYFKLRTHLTSHKDEQVYKCIMRSCHLTFPDLETFLEHTKLHEREMTYRCHVCNKPFDSLDDFGAHQYMHVNTCMDGAHRRQRSNFTFKCTKCNSFYSSPEALEHHMETTKHEFPCPHCEKVFPCNRYMRRHLNSHTNIFSVCTVCNRKFKSDYYLRLHSYIHTGEKPYSCEICHVKFNRKDKVRRHMLTHNAIKKFVCPFKLALGCERAFHRADKLKEHIKQHNNTSSSSSSSKVMIVSKASADNPAGLSSKALLCSHCKHCRFLTPSELQAHEWMCKEVPRMTCSKCDLTFNSGEALASHICKSHVVIVLTTKGEARINTFREAKRGRPKKRKPVGRPRKPKPDPTDTKLKRPPGRPRKHFSKPAETNQGGSSTSDIKIDLNNQRFESNRDELFGGENGTNGECGDQTSLYPIEEMKDLEKLLQSNNDDRHTSQ